MRRLSYTGKFVPSNQPAAQQLPPVSSQRRSIDTEGEYG
jgi:hypothetical protein